MRNTATFGCLASLLCLAAASGIGAQKPASGWNDYGGTLAGQRYSPERQIRRDNVSALRPAWVFHTHVFDGGAVISNARASAEATPVLWNGMLFFDTPFDEIFALDAATGQERWHFDPKLDRRADIYNLTSRGVALWHAAKPAPGVCGSDVVYVATLDRRLIARDATSGAACAAFGRGGTVDLLQGVRVDVPALYEFTSPPTVVGNVLVLGSSIGDSRTVFAASGAVRGFDATTGKQIWSWEPVRWTAGEKQPSSGSGNAWSVISADPENDLVYVPTGSPSVDFYGGTRLGDNKDSDSILALQASTGRRVWGFQLVHHDLWDYDVPSQPVLFTFRHKIPAVAVTTKTSMVYVFNRLTGEPLYPIVERPVPASTLPGEVAWPTQPYSTLPTLTPLTFTAADLHLRNPQDQAFCEAILKKLDNRGLFTPPSKQGALVYPGDIGGANWGSSAFDPATSVLYTRVSNMAFYVRELRPPPRGDSWLADQARALLKHLPEWAGGTPQPLIDGFRAPDSGIRNLTDASWQEGTPYVLDRSGLLTPRDVPCAPSPAGSLVAINLDTGQKLWAVPHGETPSGEQGSIGVGGVIATAGGLVFAASTNDALLRAYDSATGKELWRGQLPATAEATPMTYVANGRQYVVIYAGGHGFIGKGKSDALVAFALPATAQKANAGKTVAKKAFPAKK